MAERALASPINVATSRAAPLVNAGAANGAAATLEHLWSTVLSVTPPADRHRLVAQAAVSGFVVTQPWPERVVSADFTPCSWRLDELLAGSLDGLREQLPPEPPGEPSTGAVDFTAALHASPDLFLVRYGALNGPELGPDPLAAALSWLAEAIRCGERVVVQSSADVVAHAPWTAWLESDDALVAVLADDPALLPEGPWRRCTVSGRVAQFQEHLRAEQERRRAERRSALDAAEERYRLAADWPKRFSQLLSWRQQLEELQQARHGVGSLVRRSLLNEAREPFLEKPRRHLLAERDRHEAAYVELQTKLNEAEAHRHERWLDVEKWRQQVEQQEQVVAQRKALRPWHPQWWLMLFQGRARQRLDEFRTRHEEAKQALQQAAEAVSAAVQHLEIETQRHAAACDQIMAEAVRGRQQELDADIAELREHIERAERDWTDLVASLQGGEAIAPAPSAEHFATLVELAQQQWHQQREACARQEATETDAADWERWLLEYAAQVVVVVSDAVTVPTALALPRTFDRAILLAAHRLASEHLRAWLGLAHRAVLVGDASTPSAFASVWSLLQTGQIHPELCWLTANNELRCHWRPATRPDEVHVEYLVTHPDVALHIVDSDAETPTLAAVVFPASRYSIATAKLLLYEELGEVTLAPGKARPRWRRVGEDWHWHFAAATADEVIAELEPGLKEVLAVGDAGAWRTLRLEFCLAQGWTWAKIWSWLMRHLPGAALARTADLEATPPMQPDSLQKAPGAGE